MKTPGLVHNLVRTSLGMTFMACVNITQSAIRDAPNEKKKSAKKQNLF